MSTPRTQRGSIARKMWAAKPYAVDLKGTFYQIVSNERTPIYQRPIVVLDISPQAVEKMVEAVARAIGTQWLKSMDFERGYDKITEMHEQFRDEARAALQTILPLRKRGKR